MDLILAAGLGAIFLALAITVGIATTSTTGRTGPAQALVDIDRIYAPAARGRKTTGDRIWRPVLHLYAALGRKMTPASTAGWTQRWLDHAGNPPGWSLERVFAMQGLGFVAVGLVGGLVGVGLTTRLGLGSVTSGVLGAVLGALAGLALPCLLVFDLGQRRQEKIRAMLPDALDMLTLCVEAGLGFDQALAHVAGGTRGPLAGEIARALHEMRMGKQRSEALRALAERTTVRELRTIAIAVVQATELGVPMSAVLREQASQMRVRRRQRAEEQARKVPVKVLFPLIFCLFPALFIVVLGPGILRIMDTVLS